jgi:hypothetical protein
VVEMNETTVHKLADAMLKEMLRDKGEAQIFTDKYGKRIHKGDFVLVHGKIPATIEWLRFGYSRPFFGIDMMPLAMVDYTEETKRKFKILLNGEEVSTGAITLARNGQMNLDVIIGANEKL